MTKMNKVFQFLPALALCVALQAFTTAATAQEGFRMGLALEPNVSWLVSTDFKHETEGANFNFGYAFVADVLFSETYAIGTGINVFHTGGTFNYWQNHPEDSLVSNVRNRKVDNQYVEIPLTFKLRTKEIGYSTFYGQFGAGIGMNIKYSMNDAVDQDRVFYSTHPVGDPVAQVEIPESAVGLNDEPTNFFRLALIVGAGFERQLAGSTALMVGLKYNSSLFSTHKEPGNILAVNDQIGLPQGLSDDEQLAGEPLNEVKLKGHDSFIALSLGIVF